jgi:hypothetical protein
MARNLTVVTELCVVSQLDREDLLSPARPIVIICRRPGQTVSPVGWAT